MSLRICASDWHSQAVQGYDEKNLARRAGNTSGQYVMPAVAQRAIVSAICLGGRKEVALWQNWPAFAIQAKNIFAG
jgi:hypothetical protein